MHATTNKHYISLLYITYILTYVDSYITYTHTRIRIITYVENVHSYITTRGTHKLSNHAYITYHTDTT